MDDEIDDDEVLTQFGNRLDPAEPGHPFRRKLRDSDFDGISLLRGRLSPDEAALLVTRRPAADGHGVRYVSAGALRAEGFHVNSTPTKRNKRHVSAIMGVGVKWTEAVGERFDSCCNGEPPVWKEET